jgi:formylglycine-generating enzyme required for sulfatase activity
MVFVPGGTFTMGSDNGQSAEAPAHQVKLSPYYIDQHEVTVRQYGHFLRETPHHRAPSRIGSAEEKSQPDSESFPIVNISASDAQAYAEWAMKRLPTEAQWEFAARSTDSRLYPWGTEPLAKAARRPTRKVGPVMTLPEDVSPYGVHDLAGNALEWTHDWFDSKFYAQIANAIVDNPTGPSVRPRSRLLVVKGGSDTGRVSFRQGLSAETRLPYLGFRCVLPLEGQGGGVNPAAVAPASPPGQPSVNPPPAGNSQPETVPF